MKTDKDAFGHALYDYYTNQGGYIILERNDRLIGGALGLSVYFTEYKDWPESNKQAMKYVSGRVLDIGCGAGRHILYLQEKGFDVLGIDSSAMTVKTCLSRGVKNIKQLSINQIDCTLGKFNTILMLGNNFGLFGDFKKAKRLLKKFHEITFDNAKIIVESKDPHKSQLPEHTEYLKSNIQKNRMPGQMRIRGRYKRYQTDWYDYLLVSKNEMQKIIDGSGWEIEKFIDSEDLYIVILKKVISAD